MKRKKKHKIISLVLEKKILEDILHTRYDSIELADHLKMNPDKLARATLDSRTLRALTGMCLLSDMQAQLLLSRYRAAAVHRLIEFATKKIDGKSKVEEEMVRRSCVDVIRLDVKRADVALEQSLADDAQAPLDTSEIRRLLYDEPAVKR